MDNVCDDDFILCLQTDFQKDVLKKFGLYEDRASGQEKDNLEPFFCILDAWIQELKELASIGL